jgi:Sec-independent protein translocase protein TatA
MKFETPTTLGAKIALYLIGAVVILALLFGAKKWYDHTRDAKRQLASFQGVSAAVEHISQAADTSIQAADSVLREQVIHRTEYITKIEELKRENPEVAAYSAQCVPRELRRSACERRAARDGLTSVEAGCGRFDEAKDCAR